MLGGCLAWELPLGKPFGGGRTTPPVCDWGMELQFWPRQPPHMDAQISKAEFANPANPDELDEEFDSFPSSKPPDLVRMRYDRLRIVAGKA